MLRDVNWSGTTFGTYMKPAQLSNRLEDQMQETPYGCSTKVVKVVGFRDLFSRKGMSFIFNLCINVPPVKQIDATMPTINNKHFSATTSPVHSFSICIFVALCFLLSFCDTFQSVYAICQLIANSKLKAFYTKDNNLQGFLVRTRCLPITSKNKSRPRS